MITGNTDINAIDRNYGHYKFPVGSGLDGSTSSISGSITITTHGNPVYLITCGDNNPNGGGGYWHYINLYRDGVNLSRQIDVAPANSYNTPFGMIYLDVVPAGTYTYTITYSLGVGTI